MGKTILYARLSTSDQTVEHQREQAEKAGFEIDKVITDNGVSGISTKLSERPQVKRLFDILQSGDTLVVRWIDRLGRDYRDVSDTIRHFMREGVVIKTVINAIVFDGATTDPIQQAVRDALIAFMAAMAKTPAGSRHEGGSAGRNCGVLIRPVQMFGCERITAQGVPQRLQQVFSPTGFCRAAHGRPVTPVTPRTACVRSSARGLRGRCNSSPTACVVC